MVHGKIREKKNTDFEKAFAKSGIKLVVAACCGQGLIKFQVLGFISN
jgi:hypothetical protein